MPTYVDDYLDSIAPSRPRRHRQTEEAQPFDLTPEQTTSLLGRVGGSALSGLSATANVLDLPGSSVRDVVGLLGGGSWDKYNPFDQWLDPTGKSAAENRVTGRDLLRGGGLIGKKDTWGNWAAGLGVDILTDPSMLVGAPGLAGKAGKFAKAMKLEPAIAKHATAKLATDVAGGLTGDVARKVGWREGAMRTSLDDLIGSGVVPAEAAADFGLTASQTAKPIGSAVRFHGPLQSLLGEGFGTGATSQLAARGLDALGSTIRNSAPVRHAFANFDKRYNIGGKTATTQGAQEMMEGVSKARERGGIEAGGEMADLIQMNPKFQDVFDLEMTTNQVKSAGGYMEDGVFKPLADAKPETISLAANKQYTNTSNAITKYIEGVGDSETRHSLPDHLKPFEPQLQKMREMNINQKRWEAEVAGLESPQLVDQFADYLTRIRVGFPDSSYFGSKGAVKATHEFQKGRLPFLKDIREGTALIQEASVDPQFSGIAHTMSKDVARPGITPIRGLDSAIETLKEGKFVKQPNLTKEELEGLTTAFKEKYGDRLRLKVGAHGEEIGIPDDEIRNLVHWLSGVDPRHAQLGIPVFERNPIVALEKRLEVGRSVANTHIQFSKEIADQAVPLEDLAKIGEGSAGTNTAYGIFGKKSAPNVRGMNLVDYLIKVHGKNTFKEVPDRAKQMMMENLGDKVAVGRTEASQLASKATQAKQLESQIASEELVGKFNAKHERHVADVDRLFEDAARKQDVLKRFNAADQMTEKLDSLSDDLSNPANLHRAVQSWEDILRAAEEVKPEAIKPEVLSELADQIKTIKEPLAELDARLKDVVDPDEAARITSEWSEQASKAQIMEQARRGVTGAEQLPARSVAENAENAAKREALLQEMEQAVANAADDPLKAQSIQDSYQRLIDAIPSVPVERSVNALPSITDTIRKAISRVKGEVRRELKSSTIGNVREKLSSGLEAVLAKSTAEQERLLGRAARKVGDVGEAASSDYTDLMNRAIAEMNNVDRLEDLPLGELHQAIKETLESGANGVRETVGKAAASQSVPFDEAEHVLKNLWLPEDVANDVVGIMNGMTNPKVVGPVMQVLDRVLSHWRAAVTTHPAFHSRNHSSSNIQSALAGMWDPKSYADGWRLSRGKKITGLSKDVPEYARKGLTDDQALAALKKEIYQYQVNSLRHGQHVTQGGKRARRLVGEKPLLDPLEPGTTLGQRMNPLSVETFEPFRYSSALGDAIEQQARITPYLNLRKKGWTPEAAAKRVLEVQVDYRGGAAMDATMRRMFPFWSFTKGATAFLVKELADKPGGAFAQAIKGISRARNPSEIAPDYIAETAAIPVQGTPLEYLLGKSDSNRYLTGAGLMMEDPLSFLGGGVKGALLEAGSRGNPLPKSLAEWMTGQTFFQKGPSGGRPLEDLDPTIARTIANIKESLGGEKQRHVKPFGGDAFEFVAGNSPLSRGLTTLRTLFDPRKSKGAKALNFLTGFKVSDVSPASQDAILSERIKEAEHRLGGRDYEVTYIPQDIFDAMSPLQQLDVLRVQAAKKELAKNKKERLEQEEKEKKRQRR